MTNSRPRSVNHWAVGVTTAPRRQPTLEQTLASLKRAGWECPRLFAEPDVEVPAEYSHLPVTRREGTLGAFPNWFLAISELVMRHPHAEAYFLCQDDVLFSEGLRAYLERTLWPASRVGVVSAYCPSHYCEEKEGEGRTTGFRVEDHGWNSWGALAYVFSNPSARAMICDPAAVNHRHHGPAEGARNIDSVVGSWCSRSGLPYYVHAPSLAQHIGETSTIWSSAGACGRRQASEFAARV